MLNFLPAAIAGIAMLAVALFGLLAPAGERDARVAAIFPPWWTAQDVMASLSGSDTEILRDGIAPTVLLLASPTPGLPARLRAAGALLVIDPQAAAGCLGLSSSTARG
ncbi:hypothetical protein T8K17_05935 [Thalassobaculum sp. OXR-137]|uniref:hypothetical protein n=1 Tax=Thalassobaculum sp. OXR-137 TaxID=3100173 RepID=UPI002AC9D4B8|nr:hypothetical protein [Thalassobaculum sp. OXR-137]WPZ35681.1 hypothetical protein T8K17_05935 [Thalassobaculum sp. OXR-137]